MSFNRNSFFLFLPGTQLFLSSSQETTWMPSTTLRSPTPRTSPRRSATSSWGSSRARSTSTSAATRWPRCPPPPPTWRPGAGSAGPRRRCACATSTRASRGLSTGTAWPRCRPARRSCEWPWSRRPRCCTGAASSPCASLDCGCGPRSGSTAWPWWACS